MGLFWSMMPEEDQRPGLRLMTSDVTSSLDVELSVYCSHFDARKTQKTGRSLGASKPAFGEVGTWPTAWKELK